ncbi:alpha/beta fold hydrolase [Gordonia rhizosphera]|uniref:Putative hydrolase n=1 Tax=Gordonia rhizosphera NBRC 16068 TaxID=1108045 RepID=K6V405_9ACTN|nr:alpha/beta hydrolase [Gordonia rhizosphera]GAB90808.1 putative hydrolase [Gordonia rhizosphera NBRC 16068]
MSDQVDALSHTETLATESADGTTIGYHRLGEGSPIVIVHGSISGADSWLPVAQELAAHHTVYVLDRRGRGLSGDAEDYDLGTETDDINAVIDVATRETGEPPALLGHSYGAICVLETIRRGGAVTSMVLYEPPLAVDGPVAGEHLAEYRAAGAEGDWDGAMQVACEHFLRISPEETAGLRSTPLWADFVALAPTWSRELAEIDASAAVNAEYGALTVRTVLLVGGESPSHLVGASEYLASRLPDATKVDFPGQGHFANLMAPAAVATAIHEFLEPVA